MNTNTVENMLSYDAVPDAWPDLPEKGFVRGRSATAHDCDCGDAVFMISDSKEQGGRLTYDSISFGLPADLPIPQYALWLPMGAVGALPAIVTQAEINGPDSVAPGDPSFGLRLASGYTEIGTDADTVLLGTDLAAIRGLSIRELINNFGTELFDCRADLAALREDVANQWATPSPTPRPRCLSLPILVLRGRRYAVVTTRPFEWYSRLLFENSERGFPGIPLEYRIIDLVRYPECPSREFSFTQYTLADALLERENLTPPEQAVFDAWFAHKQVQSNIAAARFELTGMNPQRAMLPHNCNLYSRLQYFLSHCRLESADAEQWRHTLENACSKGLSRTELAWSGLPEFLALRHDRIHRKELLDALDLGALRVRVFSEVSYEGDDRRADGTLNADAARWRNSLCHRYFARDERMWPHNAKSIVCGNGYAEWRILAEDDVATVTERHFGGQRNAIAHLRTTLRDTLDGETMLCIDEAQSDWPALLLRESARVIPDTPYRQHWIDVAVRVALLAAANEGIRRVCWVNGRIAQELHLEGSAPSLDLIYDHLLPQAMQRALRGTSAQFTTVAVPTWSRDWQCRVQKDGEQFEVYHYGLPTEETWPTWDVAKTELARRAHPINETLHCVELDDDLLNRIMISGLPWLGAPDWTREYRELNDWRRDRQFELFAPKINPFASQRSELTAGRTRLLHSIDVDVYLRWGDRATHTIEWTLRIDDQAILETLDPAALIRSAAEIGDFFIFTCTCGAPSCSDIFDPVLVAQSARQIRWEFESPRLLDVEKGVLQTLVFSKRSYREAISRALARTYDLLSRYPEAGTGISDDLWRNVPACHYDPKQLPPATRLPVDCRRIDIGWFWSSTGDEEWCPGEFDFLVNGQRASLSDLLPVRSIREAWRSWRMVFWREDEEDETTEHMPKRQGSFTEINQRGFALAKAVAQVVPKTVLVWFHPVGAYPARPERANKNFDAVRVLSGSSRLTR